MAKNSDPMFVSKARKKELSRMLDKAFERYPLEKAFRDVDLELKREKIAARQNS
ncbi:MAG: hypothetical protein SFW07_05070 [Gammaproteobacteria bacterium]|nr:hypothetical protein [Gammaproteobacteria bacterium]